MLKQTNNLITLGHIVGSFGIKGWVKIKLDFETIKNLDSYKGLQLKINDVLHDVVIEDYSVHDKLINTKFLGIDDRTKADTLRGALLVVDRLEFPVLADSNEYYLIDLLGLSVYNHEDHYFGDVNSFIETGANIVLVIKQQPENPSELSSKKPVAKETLIPFVGVYITNVDLENKKIIVNWGIDY